jgi:hypothetical protein
LSATPPELNIGVLFKKNLPHHHLRVGVVGFGRNPQKHTLFILQNEMLDIELLPTGEAEALFTAVVNDEYWNVVNYLASYGLSWPLYEAYNYDQVHVVVFWRPDAFEVLEQFGESKEEITENLKVAFHSALTFFNYNIV